MVAAGFYWSLDGVSALAARQVPPQWEQKLGESVIEQYRLEHRFMDDSRAAAVLAPLVAPLVETLPPAYRGARFYIVDDASINAFALPGGHVVIHSGLLLRAGRAAALQGVLGHELAHVTQQHGLRAMIRSAGLYLTAQLLIGDASGLAAALANAAPMLINQTYSRDFEREADALGYDYVKRAKIDPRGLAEFFELMLSEEQRALKQIENDTARQRLSQEPASGWRDDQAAFVALQDAVKAAW
jgi:beta-barrel assembly-enhancing protease